MVLAHRPRNRFRLTACPLALHSGQLRDLPTPSHRSNRDLVLDGKALDRRVHVQESRATHGSEAIDGVRHIWAVIEQPICQPGQDWVQVQPLLLAYFIV